MKMKFLVSLYLLLGVKIFIYIHGAPAGSKKRLFGDGKEVTIVCVSYVKVPNLSDEELNKFIQNPKA